MKSEVYFRDLEVSSIEGKTIFLDIDGTLVCDGGYDMTLEDVMKVQILSQKNYVLLCSNKKDHARNQKLAESLGVSYINSPFKKPSRKILGYFKELPPEDRVIIGDKYMTDGVFAHRIGAHFLKVKRIRGQDELFVTRIIYALDDFIYFLQTRVRNNFF